MKEEEKCTEGVQRLKELLVISSKILDNEGVYDYVGHVSARVPGADQMLITPHLRALSFREVTPRDILTLDFKGNQMEGGLRHPWEFWIHACIYKARPDVNSVVHVHPEACVAMGVAEQPILPIYVIGGLFAKGVPLFKAPGLVTTEKLGDDLAKTLGDCNAALLKWHGAVVVGTSVEQACVSTVGLERLARIQLSAMAVAGAKGIQPLPDSALDPELIHYGAGWKYFVSRLPK